MNVTGRASDQPGDDAEYKELALLDDLETLLEDMEEAGITGEGDDSQLPDDLKSRMEEFNVKSVQQLRAKLMRLHAQVNEDDRDITVSES